MTRGKENWQIDWAFQVGDRVKIRLENGMDQDHPMHHPFHIHGAGRFLVLAHDGEPDDNLVWKDTVLVRSGETVDILLDVTNEGLWMAHCHIAEHNQSRHDVQLPGHPEGTAMSAALTDTPPTIAVGADPLPVAGACITPAAPPTRRETAVGSRWRCCA